MSLNQTVERTVTGLGYELVDVERAASGLLRVTIDRVPGKVYPTGGQDFIIVEDCEAVTRQLQYVLEVANADYARLEVSSPGLDRPLKTPEHYARFVGEQVQIILKLPFQGRKKYQGVLQAGETSGWRLILGSPEPAGGKKAKSKPRAAATESQVDQVLDFAFDEVREARLVPVIDFKGRRGNPGPAATPPDGADAASNQDDGGQEE